MPRAPDPDKALAAALKALRESKQATQETIAYRAGVSVGTLGRIETGRTAPSWDTVRRVIAALEITLAELASAVEAQEPKRAT